MYRILYDVHVYPFARTYIAHVSFECKVECKVLHSNRLKGGNVSPLKMIA